MIAWLILAGLVTAVVVMTALLDMDEHELDHPPVTRRQIARAERAQRADLSPAIARDVERADARGAHDDPRCN